VYKLYITQTKLVEDTDRNLYLPYLVLLLSVTLNETQFLGYTIEHSYIIRFVS